MPKSSKIIAACLAAAFIFSSTGFTAEKKEKKAPNPEAMFKKYDKDKSGSVSLEEYTAKAKDDKIKTKMEGMFKKIDANSDGSLDQEELKNHVAKMATKKKKK